MLGVGAALSIGLALVDRHEVERAASVRLNREGWQDTIAKMVDLGASGSDAELAKVLDYLGEHFKGDAPRSLNLNTATAIELESIVGLLRKESAAWIAHRKASGPCKSVDDLKKVAGVPFKKIDERGYRTRPTLISVSQKPVSKSFQWS